MATVTIGKSVLERAGDRVIAVAERILALGLIAAILMDFINVIGRYSGAFSVIGVDEAEIYILIWIAFLGAVAVTWRGQHLRMDVFLEALPHPAKQAVIVFEMAVMLVLTSFVGVQSYTYVAKLFALGAVSDILGVPTWIPHIAVCVSLLAMAAIVLVRGVQRFARTEAR